MHINRLKIDGFKNLSDIDFTPDKGYNIIVGKNAQGKTNILEAIWLLTGCRSFRGSRERDYIGFERDCAEMELDFTDSVRKQNIKARYIKAPVKGKEYFVNSVPVKSTGALFERFKCVAFLPDDAEIVKGSPDKRRSYVDICYSQLVPRSLKYLRRYELLITQRNIVLKTINSGYDNTESLTIWDSQIAEAGAYISFMRHKYVLKLCSLCQDLYKRITGGSEELTIEYQSNALGDYPFEETPVKEMAEEYFKRLSANMLNDIRLGFTQVGIHRDEIELKINGRSVKDYGSQGQKKSTALVMKLAQAELLSEEGSEPPVILLDDVMSELDETRQEFIGKLMQDMQVFVTTCSESAVKKCGDAKVFHVNGGKLVTENE